MDDTENKTRGEVKELSVQLQEMSVNMRIFSLTMRSLYTENAVGTDNELARRFRELRDKTRDDAIVYLKVILPTSTKFVASISEYFEYYEALEYEEWVDMIKDIHEETVAYRGLCEALVKMHEEFLVPLIQRKGEADKMIKEFKDLTEEYERQKKELEDAASTKRGWAYGLCWVPFINLIATPILAAYADSDLAESVAKGQEAQIAEVATIVVSTSLIPALEKFIDGLTKAAGFFSVMENELRNFEGKAEKAEDKQKKLYYKVMNKEAKDMKSICRNFYAVIPNVRTDFLAIPQDGTDQNYVDKWLEKQKKTIRENCKVPKFVKNFTLKAITG